MSDLRGRRMATASDGQLQPAQKPCAHVRLKSPHRTRSMSGDRQMSGCTPFALIIYDLTYDVAWLFS